MSAPLSANRGRPALATLLALGLFMSLGLAALIVLGGEQPGRGTSVAGPTPIVGQVAPGQPAPDFTATTLNGETIRLSDLRGHPVALNFWATWCGPCRLEMPELEAAQSRYREAGLVILTINAGEDAEKVQAYLDELGLTLTVVLDPQGTLLDLYEVRALPTTVWIDEEGFIRAEHLGPLDAALIDRYVGELLGFGAAASTIANGVGGR